MKIFNENIFLTDWYELTMLQAYFMHDRNEPAVFEFFIRNLPESRNFLIAGGLAQLIYFLSQLKFTQADLEWLANTNKFSSDFLDSLKDFHFSGDIDAVAEGTLIFSDEPLVRITAPLREAQLIESRLINLLQFQTLVASKAARLVIAARGKQLIDFGLRRSHGAEAAILSARASYIAGFDGTATVLANQLFDIPVFGTMAHSYIQTYQSEMQAFNDFCLTYPNSTTLLIDTYDTEFAAEQVVRINQWIRAEAKGIDFPVSAVRIDSGDLGLLTRRVRQILDAGNMTAVRIICSGNLDEYRIEKLMSQHAPVDGFGVGSNMNTSADAPYLDCAYKLVEYAALPCRKKSLKKATLPGRKQVFRMYDQDGLLAEDILGLAHEDLPGEKLLSPVMRDGILLKPEPALIEIRLHAKRELNRLPKNLRSLEKKINFKPKISDALTELVKEVDERLNQVVHIDQGNWHAMDE